ncbi:YjcZ family sporulation protein [Thalassobacillus hwangdonensis]|uniref:YjcZ family sporulation protein n=1 Tax=Thalassobacillus hwangdonensis TaxID=546108 RepID=A0ABW3L4K4_9BACI
MYANNAAPVMGANVNASPVMGANMPPRPMYTAPMYGCRRRGNETFVLVVVLFILLIIIGACYCY